MEIFHSCSSDPSRQAAQLLSVEQAMTTSWATIGCSSAGQGPEEVSPVVRSMTVEP